MRSKPNPPQTRRFLPFLLLLGGVAAGACADGGHGLGNEGCYASSGDGCY